MTEVKTKTRQIYGETGGQVKINIEKIEKEERNREREKSVRNG